MGRITGYQALHAELLDYFLRLSLDSASVPCDANGVVMPGITMPSTTAQLCYGGAVYDGVVNYNATIPSGDGSLEPGAASISNQSGVFTLKTLTAERTEITISAYIGIKLVATKVWGVSKSRKGADGNSIVAVYRMAETKPPKPEGTTIPPAGWSLEVPDINALTVTGYTGAAWTVEGEWRKSPSIPDNGITKQRISFTAAKATTIAIEIVASSEPGYDYILVGLLDNASLSRESNYTDRASGSETKTVMVNVPSAGSHFVEVAYAKDGSSVAGGDYGKYRVLTGAIWQSNGTTLNGQATAWSDVFRLNGKDGTDGTDGRDGTNGPVGPAGPAFRPRGEWKTDQTYYRNDAFVDYVLKTGPIGLTLGFYVREGKTTVTSNTPPENDSANWVMFSLFDVVATKVLLANFALIAGAVFKDNTLFSQTGKLNELDSSDYTHPNFIPTVKIDWISGLMECLNATIKGGKIGGFKVTGDFLTNEGMNNDATLIFENSAKGKVSRVGAAAAPISSGIDPVAVFRNEESGTLENYAMTIGAKNALSYDGNYAMAMWNGFISGFAVKPLRVSSSIELSHADVYVSCYNNQNITVTLPSSPEPGKIVYIRRMYDAGVNIAGNGKQIYTAGPSTSLGIDTKGKCVMLEYDGINWLANAILW